MKVKKFYKYLDLEGAKLTLQNGNVRLSRPSELNDPFDVEISDLYGMDLDEIINDGYDDNIGFLLSDPVNFSKFIGANVEDTLLAAKILPCLPVQELQKMREQANFLMKERKKLLLEDSIKVSKIFKNSAIFCASKIFDSPLMWSHYAEKHKGIVLGFTPVEESDSIITVLSPVKYTKNRPQFMQRNNFGIGAKPQDLEKLAESIFYTKSDIWEYEHEVRLYLPDYIEDDSCTHTLLTYPDDELTEIYFGCRSSEEAKKELLDLAFKRNKNIKAYQSKIRSRTYDLDFELIN